MCHSPLHSFLVALPKCEHHMHLEGALSPLLLFEIASRNKISLPTPSEDASFASTASLLERYARFASLDDFLHYYFIGMTSLIHARDFEDLAWDYFLRAKEHGVLHAEVFFDPQAHTSRGIEFKTVVSGFEKACKRAENELGISTLLIPCLLRHLPVQDGESAYHEALGDLRNGRLAGLGLSSSEKGYPPGLFKDIYKEAKEANIRRTAHAGEEGPVEYIREAIRVCDIQRIDHGFRLAEDEELMKEVAEKQMLVTLCPLSNLKLQCVSDVGQLPVRKFLDAGVQFSINCDDPAYFTSYIQDNYCAVQEAFDLSINEWSRIAKAAVRGSWCHEQRKQFLLDKVQTVVAAHGK
ncbi:uncharacterized protein KY384_006578 [Bacidia gigantensis]|uniref:uncharacterized protein n=1 Tax=Bacidia gigantensis TaxID=2732470 RepID=UPI001D053A2A|nr:uncharacterized protein KY384_006578 [Bacidia gigantensis]KAG8528889.1 hypothetical protein KY384_006578 [Bacidia gigantensis]